MRNVLSVLLTLTATLVTLSCSKEDDFNPDLINGFWKVQTLKPTDGQLISSENIGFSLDFSDDDYYTISLDVNQCGGKYSITKDFEISFDRSGFCTQVCCDSKDSHVFARIVISAAEFSLDEDQLTILGPDGEVQLKRVN